MSAMNKTPGFDHRVLFTPDEVAAAVADVALRISAYVHERGYAHVHVIPLLQGALMFSGPLIAALRFKANISIEAVVTPKFRHANQPEALRVDEFRLDLPENSAILILDDVYDTGETLCAVLQRCAIFAPTIAGVLISKDVPDKKSRLARCSPAWTPRTNGSSASAWMTTAPIAN